jgi:Amt family ammonium transporter
MFHASTSPVNLLWIFVCAFLVMLMQAGFCLLETGFARAKNGINVAIKNLVDFLISSLVFWAFGFGLMFGTSQDGLIGTSRFFPGAECGTTLLAMLFFQLMFCSTATTIISGAVAERIRFRAYMLTALVVSAVAYPVFGHWAWGGTIDGQATGWLGRLGFLDFAGSTVVHSLGAWISLALCRVIGPRIGRFDRTKPPMSGHDLPMSTIGAMLLWFSWFGFNGGSTLGMTDAVPLVLLNTNLAAAAGGLAALGAAWRFQGRPDVGQVINGVIGGLVAVTASCNVISPLSAVAIGLAAGILVVRGTLWLERRKIDDVVGAIPVHGFCGVWGTLAVALFGDPAMFPHGHSRYDQFLVQAAGAGTCFLWAMGIGYLVLGAFHKIRSFRVSATAEIQGLNVSEHGASTELLELLTNMDRDRREGDFGKPVYVEPHTEVGQIATEYNRVIRRAHDELEAREKAAEALRRAEEKYRGIFENAVEGMFQTSRDGRYLSANPALAHIYGYTAPEELMQSLSDIGTQLYVEPRRRDDFRQEIERDGIVVNFESQVYRRDGSVIWISENARAIRDKDGNVQSYEGTVIDITDRREAVAMQAQVEAAEAASRAKSEFLANMSHEIRTPLNGVMGMLELLGTTTLDERQERFVHLARSSSEALLALINQILDFSKIEAGKLELEHVEFDLHPLIEDLSEVLGHRAAKKGIELACCIHVDVPNTVGGDPERLRQVVVNLANNAVKFTESGRVEIDVAFDSASDWRPHVVFEVRDTGIGVPANRRDRLFQPFSQVDASTTRKYGGTGLGLSICKQLVEIMGGTIEYAERIGGGSIFRFRLPLEVRQAAKPIVRRLPQELCSLRVLAVDDVDVNRELLDEHCRGWGLTLDTAHDAESALEMVHLAAKAGAPYRLVMLDRNLPDMDGLELATRIHDDAAHADARLLLLTSLSESPHRDELQRWGIDDVLYKPLRQSYLFDALMNLAAAAAASDAPSAPKQTIGEPRTQVRGSTPAAVNPQTRRLTPTARPAPFQQPATRGATILVADDNEVNRMVTEEILRSAGYAAHLVTNGREAVDAAATGRFDLILMDCQMPVLDGFSAVGELRHREAMGELFQARGPMPIIALTANAVRGDREKCLAAGMNGYVSKPIDRSALLAEIERFVGTQTPAETVVIKPAAAADLVPTPDDDGGSTALPEARDAAAIEADVFQIDELLHRCQGDHDFAGRVLDKFRKRLPQEVGELRQAFAARDVERVRSVAHQLKGCAGNVGAVAVHRDAAAIEVAVVDGIETCDVTALERDAVACLNTLDRLLKEFNRS